MFNSIIQARLTCRFFFFAQIALEQLFNNRMQATHEIKYIIIGMINKFKNNSFFMNVCDSNTVIINYKPVYTNIIIL